MPKPTQDHQLFRVTTPFGKDKLLFRRIRGKERLSGLFEYEVEMIADAKDLQFKKIVGQGMTVALEFGNGYIRYIHGVVERFVQSRSDEKDQNDTHYSTYSALLRPWLWNLTLTRNCRIFQNLSAPEIIKKVFNDLGFKDYQDALKGTYAKRVYCVQYQETAFDFVSRLMEDEGIFYFFTHADGKHTLVLADDLDAHKDCVGYKSVRFWEADEAAKPEDTVFECTLSEQVGPGKYAVDDFNFETPATDLLTEVKGKSGDMRVYEYAPGYIKKDQGDRIAKLRIEGLEWRNKLLRGSGYCIGFVAGHKFTLKEHPRPDINATYVLGELELTASGHEYQNSFEAFPANVPFRAPRVTPRPRITGTQTAIVTGKSGEELWTDKYGRVKLQFHWDQEGKGDENSSCWVRVNQGWAGKGWGGLWIPRVGQEVIVSYLNGDPDTPVVVGAVYNAQQTVPYKLPDEQTKSTLKSHSFKGKGAQDKAQTSQAKLATGKGAGGAGAAPAGAGGAAPASTGPAGGPSAPGAGAAATPPAGAGATTPGATTAAALSAGAALGLGLGLDLGLGLGGGGGGGGGGAPAGGAAQPQAGPECPPYGRLQALIRCEVEAAEAALLRGHIGACAWCQQRCREAGSELCQCQAGADPLWPAQSGGPVLPLSMQCPDAATLHALAGQTLAGDAYQSARRHVAGCAFCRERYAALGGKPADLGLSESPAPLPPPPAGECPQDAQLAMLMDPRVHSVGKDLLKQVCASPACLARLAELASAAGYVLLFDAWTDYLLLEEPGAERRVVLLDQREHCLVRGEQDFLSHTQDARQIRAEALTYREQQAEQAKQYRLAQDPAGAGDAWRLPRNRVVRNYLALSAAFPYIALWQGDTLTLLARASFSDWVEDAETGARRLVSRPSVVVLEDATDYALLDETQYKVLRGATAPDAEDEIIVLVDESLTQSVSLQAGCNYALFWDPATWKITLADDLQSRVIPWDDSAPVSPAWRQRGFYNPGPALLAEQLGRAPREPAAGALGTINYVVLRGYQTRKVLLLPAKTQLVLPKDAKIGGIPKSVPATPLQVGECAPDDTLLSLLDDRLDGNQRVALLKHVSGCGRCQGRCRDLADLAGYRVILDQATSFQVSLGGRVRKQAASLKAVPAMTDAEGRRLFFWKTGDRPGALVEEQSLIDAGQAVRVSAGCLVFAEDYRHVLLRREHAPFVILQEGEASQAEDNLIVLGEQTRQVAPEKREHYLVLRDDQSRNVILLDYLASRVIPLLYSRTYLLRRNPDTGKFTVLGDDGRRILLDDTTDNRELAGTGDVLLEACPARKVLLWDEHEIAYLVIHETLLEEESGAGEEEESAEAEKAGETPGTEGETGTPEQNMTAKEAGAGGAAGGGAGAGAGAGSGGGGGLSLALGALPGLPTLPGLPRLPGLPSLPGLKLASPSAPAAARRLAAGGQAASAGKAGGGGKASGGAAKAGQAGKAGKAGKMGGGKVAPAGKAPQPGFNEIRFDDKADKEEIYIHAQKDLNVKVWNDETRVIKMNRSVTIEEKDDKLTVAKGNRVTTIKLARTTTVEEKDDTLTLGKGSRLISIKQKDYKLTLDKGNRQIDVKTGKEVHNVKGTRDLKVEGNETHKNQANFTHKVQGNYVLKVTGNLTIDVTGNIVIKSAKNVEMKSGMNLKLKAGMNMKAEAGMNLHNKAGITLKNEAGVTLDNKAGVMMKSKAGVMMKSKAGVMMKNEGGVMLDNKAGVMMKNKGGVMLSNEGGVLHQCKAGAILMIKGGIVMIN